MRTMIDVRQRLELTAGASRTCCSLPRLEKAGFAAVSRLPVSLRILRESVLRNVDGVQTASERLTGDADARAASMCDTGQTMSGGLYISLRHVCAARWTSIHGRPVAFRRNPEGPKFDSCYGIQKEARGMRQ